MGETQAGQGGVFNSELSRRVSVSMVVLGTVAAVIGLMLLLVPSDQASFGWFAYAPLSNTTFSPIGLQLSPRSQIGIALFIVGLAVLAFGAGWMLGQRQAASQRRLPDPGSTGN
jgi:heme/copper-type cytochrome/quinol oxidase subunit 1